METRDNSLFLAGLKEWGLELSDKQLEQFERYYEMLVEKNKVMNLTAITEYEDVITKHFVDSLALSRVMPLQGKKDLRQFLRADHPAAISPGDFSVLAVDPAQAAADKKYRA